MRPNIRISHTLNGRVKDYAAERDLALDEAYKQIIEQGLAAAENEDEERDTRREELTTEPPTQQADAPTVAEYLSGWEHGRFESEIQASEAIAIEATKWLAQQENTVQKRHVPLDELADADPEERSEETLWTEVIQSAWQYLEEQGVVKKPHSRGYEWVGRKSQTD